MISLYGICSFHIVKHILLFALSFLS